MKCKICGNSINNKIYEVKEMKFGFREVFLYFQCNECECLQILEPPSDIAKYYPEEFSSFQINPENRVRNLLKRIIVNSSNKQVVYGNDLLGRLFAYKFCNHNLRSLSDTGVDSSSRILDIGCGNGYDVYALNEIGIKNVMGVDAFIEKDIVYANGVKIIKGQIFDVNGEWDVVMFHHSFEHMFNPLAVLQKASTLLFEGGSCLIRIPVVPCFAWENYGVNWVQLDAPRHFFIHSKKSMMHIAKQANFYLEKVVYDSDTLQFYGSEQYLRDIPLNSTNSYSNNPKTSLFTKDEIKKFAVQAQELNHLGQGDQAAFYFRKK